MDLSKYPASTRYLIQTHLNNEPFDILWWDVLRHMERPGVQAAYQNYREALKKWESEEFMKGQAFGL